MQEEKYHKDFWSFSKRVCHGTLGQLSVKPTLPQSETDVYSPTKYSTEAKLDTGHLNWFPYIPVQNDKYVNFDISPIAPKLVKSVLFKNKSTSAPRPDGLMHGLLNNLPAAHHCLATLYTILLDGIPRPTR